MQGRTCECANTDVVLYSLSFISSAVQIPGSYSKQENLIGAKQDSNSQKKYQVKLKNQNEVKSALGFLVSF